MDMPNKGRMYMNSKFDPQNYLTTEALQKGNRPLKIRAALFKALCAQLALAPVDEFLIVPKLSSIDEVRTHERMPLRYAAQEMAMLVEMGRGFAPIQANIDEIAELMTTVFSAYCPAFAAEGFPNPAKAAIESMKELGFHL
jgi:hypothetical protein